MYGGICPRQKSEIALPAAHEEVGHCDGVSCGDVEAFPGNHPLASVAGRTSCVKETAVAPVCQALIQHGSQERAVHRCADDPPAERENAKHILFRHGAGLHHIVDADRTPVQDRYVYSAGPHGRTRGAPAIDSRHSRNAARQRPRMPAILWQIVRAFGWSVVAEHEKRGGEKRNRGSGVCAALTKTLQCAVSPHRSDRAAEALECSGSALHCTLLFLRSAVAHERHDGRIAQSDADARRNQ